MKEKGGEKTTGKNIPRRAQLVIFTLLINLKKAN